MSGDDDTTTRPPADAFGILGNETRLEILRALSEVDGPVSFTDLRRRVGIERGAEFNYHLGKLVGHFVARTDEGYTLRTPGSRVVEAIHSGAVTEHPVIDPTVLDQECYHCGAPIMLTYDGHLAVHCTRCRANYAVPVSGTIEQAEVDTSDGEIGLLAGYELPPAGIQDRSDSDALRVGTTWANLERLAVGVDICPRCSAKTDASIEVCDSHDQASGECSACGNRHAVIHAYTCTNCNYGRRTQFGRMLLTDTDLLNFVTGHGINPVAPRSPMAFMALLDGYEEDVVSTDPFRGRFTFTIDDDAITLTVDEDLSVVETTQHDADTVER